MEQTLLGIIGHHIGYTLSPAMHHEAIRMLGLPYSYGVFDTTGEMLPGLMHALRSPTIRGVNVTKPHKEAVIPYMDELSDEARTLGAVNTIINTNGRLRGENTDVDGIRASLLPHRETIKGHKVLLLGAGGAARAALYAAAESAPASIAIYNRSPQRAAQLADAFHPLCPAVSFDLIGPEAITKAAEEATLIVNTTTIGQKPDIGACPVPEAVRFSNQQIIFDIIYSPLQTVLLQRAKAAGATVIDGLEMFIRQGARAFTLWTGKPFPIKEARERVLCELDRQ